MHIPNLSYNFPTFYMQISIIIIFNIYDISPYMLSYRIALSGGDISKIKRYNY
jgi:hypothetical protein